MVQEFPNPSPQHEILEGRPPEISEQKLSEYYQLKQYLEQVLAEKIAFENLEISGNRLGKTDQPLSDIEQKRSDDPYSKLTISELEQEIKVVGRIINAHIAAEQSFKRQLRSGRLEDDISHQ